MTARCGGAARTNCSVGISDEGMQRIKDEIQRMDEMTTAGIVLFVCVAIVAMAIVWREWS